MKTKILFLFSLFLVLGISSIAYSQTLSGVSLKTDYKLRGAAAVGTTVSAPSNTGVPSISGNAREGENLTASTGTWTGSPTSYTYQWKADGVAIPGAGNSMYTLTRNESGADITVTVTAVNSNGNSSATSNIIGPVFGSVLEVNFVTGTYWDITGRTNLGAIVTTRASGVSQIQNASGNWVIAAANSLRLDGLSRGLLVEPTRQNIAKYNRDFRQNIWVKTNATTTVGEIGIDGTTAVTKVVATANNAKVLQSATSASVERVASMYVKRITGTGPVYMTMNAADTTDSANTATWTEVPVSNTWTRVSIPAQILANPIFGIKLATQGDSIAIDSFQMTQGRYATSPIFTKNASVVRPADAPYVDVTPLLNRLDMNNLTVVIDFESTQQVGALTMLEFNNSSSPKTLRHTINGNPVTNHYGWSVFGTGQGYDPQVPFVSGRHIFAGTIDAVKRKIAVALDGSVERTGSPISFPTGLDRLNIGHQNGGNQLGGYVRRIKVYAGTAQAGAMTQFSTQ